jgi:hypothetical protein
MMTKPYWHQCTELVAQRRRPARCAAASVPLVEHRRKRSAYPALIEAVSWITRFALRAFSSSFPVPIWVIAATDDREPLDGRGKTGRAAAGI